MAWFDQIFRQIASIRGKTLRNTNFVDSRHIKRENVSLPVDVRRSKLSLLKLRNVYTTVYRTISVSSSVHTRILWRIEAAPRRSWHVSVPLFGAVWTGVQTLPDNFSCRYKKLFRILWTTSRHKVVSHFRNILRSQCFRRILKNWPWNIALVSPFLIQKQYLRPFFITFLKRCVKM